MWKWTSRHVHAANEKMGQGVVMFAKGSKLVLEVFGAVQDLGKTILKKLS